MAMPTYRNEQLAQARLSHDKLIDKRDAALDDYQRDPTREAYERLFAASQDVDVSAEALADEYLEAGYKARWDELVALFQDGKGRYSGDLRDFAMAVDDRSPEEIADAYPDQSVTHEDDLRMYEEMHREERLRDDELEQVYGTAQPKARQLTPRQADAAQPGVQTSNHVVESDVTKYLTVDAYADFHQKLYDMAQDAREVGVENWDSSQIAEIKTVTDMLNGAARASKSKGKGMSYDEVRAILTQAPIEGNYDKVAMGYMAIEERMLSCQMAARSFNENCDFVFGEGPTDSSAVLGWGSELAQAFDLDPKLTRKCNEGYMAWVSQEMSNRLGAESVSRLDQAESNNKMLVKAQQGGLSSKDAIERRNAESQVQEMFAQRVRGIANAWPGAFNKGEFDLFVEADRQAMGLIEHGDPEYYKAGDVEPIVDLSKLVLVDEDIDFGEGYNERDADGKPLEMSQSDLAAMLSKNKQADDDKPAVEDNVMRIENDEELSDEEKEQLLEMRRLAAEAASAQAASIGLMSDGEREQLDDEDVRKREALGAQVAAGNSGQAAELSAKKNPQDDLAKAEAKLQACGERGDSMRQVMYGSQMLNMMMQGNFNLEKAAYIAGFAAVAAVTKLDVFNPMGPSYKKAKQNKAKRKYDKAARSVKVGNAIKDARARQQAGMKPWPKMPMPARVQNWALDRAEALHEGRISVSDYANTVSPESMGAMYAGIVKNAYDATARDGNLSMDTLEEFRTGTAAMSNIAKRQGMNFNMVERELFAQTLDVLKCNEKGEFTPDGSWYKFGDDIVNAKDFNQFAEKTLGVEVPKYETYLPKVPTRSVGGETVEVEEPVDSVENDSDKSAEDEREFD